MKTDDVARVALGVVVSGFAAVAITKTGVLPGSAVARWVLFCAIAGVVINSPEGMKRRDALVGSAACAAGLVVALLWLALLGRGVIPSFSGVSLDFSANPTYFSTVLGACFLVTCAGVLAGTLARPATLDLLQRIGNVKAQQARNIESFLRMAFSICGAGALFLL
jgi:hypothetical protein